MITPSLDYEAFMQRAIELARRGEGRVEPNPMVGCLLVKHGTIIGEGWHEEFGEGHAEVNAIRAAQLAGQSTDAATAYVTLEPCCHHGKTPPCTDALIKAKIARVVIAHLDPNPQISGVGMRQLQDYGIEVEVGIEQGAAAQLLAPYLKRLVAGKPWIIAKWAMSWDGKIATRTGDSQWISNEMSRAIVHSLRGRVDAIMVGANSARVDDPLLTARPSGARVATRIVMDSTASLKSNSQLCQTAREFPTLVATGPAAPVSDVKRLREIGCEVWVSSTADPNQRLVELLEELARRMFTNVLVEGGGGLLGSLNDLGHIDEVHAFIGPRLIGGSEASSPISGKGQAVLAHADWVQIQSVQQLDQDVYLVGRKVC